MNSVSSNYGLNYTAANVGVLTAPDSVGKIKLYSNEETEKKFKQFNSDISSKQKKISFENKKKTPKPVLYFLGAAGIFTSWKLLKIIFRK